MVNLIFILFFTVWCTVQLTKNDGTTNEYDVRSSYLETENGEKVTLKDLFYGSNVIWKARGRPYAVVVMETHRKYCVMYVSLAVCDIMLLSLIVNVTLH